MGRSIVHFDAIKDLRRLNRRSYGGHLNPGVISSIAPSSNIMHTHLQQYVIISIKHRQVWKINSANYSAEFIKSTIQESTRQEPTKRISMMATEAWL
jgi:hypothetical protein